MRESIVLEQGKAKLVEVLHIRTSFKLHQREYVRDQAVSAKSFGDQAWGWLFPGLEELAARSLAKPVAQSFVTELLRGFCIAKDLVEWHDLTSLRPVKARLEDVVRFFSAFEAALLGDPSLSPARKARVSYKVRRFVSEFLKVSSSDGRIQRIRNFYRSILRSPDTHRILISDIPSPGSPPIGAIGHSSHLELKESVSKILHADIDSIKAACLSILDEYETALAEIANLTNVKIDNTSEIRIGLKLSAPSVDIWPKDDVEAYLALRIQGRLKIFEGSMKARRLRSEPPGAKSLLRERIGLISNGSNIADLIELDIAPPALVLLACALVIQIHTHWNFISVLELTYENLKAKTFPHRLQSVKPRTSDGTPVVFVERSDDLVIRAMKCLTDRYERLLNAGRIEAEEQSVWISSRAVRTGGVWPVVSWGSELRSMTERYNLKPFTLEQVRCQCLAIVSIGNRGLSGVIQTAGHAGDSTSVRYIDKILLRRLNSANLLEFEKKLEQDIHYVRKGGVGKILPVGLFPIGDGSSCACPTDPPKPDWLEAGLCRAEHCHQEDGCVHRRILINEDRIEEVVRLKRFYAGNWERLAAENIVSFEIIHAPQIFFNFALYGILRRGPHRHLVKRYEEA